MHKRPRAWKKDIRSTVDKARSAGKSMIRPVILDASGLALICIGAFHTPVVGQLVGFVVTGLACLAFKMGVFGDR